MPRGQLLQAMQRVRRLVEPRPADGDSDAQLLERFAQRREARAFEMLLHRYGPLVLGLCGRLLRHRQDAEDAFQATFLVLAHKAKSIRQHESVGSWLYGVAFRVAGQAKRAAARRHLHERPIDPEEDMPGRPCDPAEESCRRELDALLDEEVLRLPAKYRRPVILCCLQGKSNEEAARELGVPKGTVQGRLARARECLRRRLERRGVALGIGILSTSIPVPSILADHTLQAAGCYVEGAALPPAAVTGNALVLSQGALRAMFLTKLKWIVVLMVVAGGIVGGSGAAAYRLARAADPLPAGAAANDPRMAPVHIGLRGEQVAGQPVVAVTPLSPEDQEGIVKVASPLDGVVQEVKVKVGSKVRKGELLVQLDGRLAETDVRIQTAKVAAAEADLLAATETTRFRQAQLLRSEALRKSGAINQEAIQESKIAYEQSKADLAGKRKNLEVAKVELERARITLEMYSIRSPVEGTIAAVVRKPGEALKRLETAIVVRLVKE